MGQRIYISSPVWNIKHFSVFKNQLVYFPPCGPLPRQPQVIIFSQCSFISVQLHALPKCESEIIHIIMSKADFN